jgi:hypothetical protein
LVFQTCFKNTPKRWRSQNSGANFKSRSDRFGSPRFPGFTIGLIGGVAASSARSAPEKKLAPGPTMTDDRVREF